MNERSLLNPIQKFIKAESFSGVLLFVSTVLALIVANSPLQNWYQSIWQYEIGFKSEDFKLVKPLILWINDGLMAIFFFVVGLEIKREILLGELNKVKKASLPLFAAVGGMVIPMAIYLLMNSNPETSGGWGISMATDIAFSLAILTLLGSRVPLGLKIFLTAFAIIDDIGAVLVIAIFYTNELAWNLLLIAGVMLAVLYILSALKLHSKFLLLAFGIVIWVLFLKAGIHPTIAGILLAFAVPIRQKINEFDFAEKLQAIVSKITGAGHTNKLPILTHQQIEAIDNLEDWTGKVQSPLQQLEHRLHKWVAFFIMPVFAFSNAGVSLNSDVALDVSLASTVGVSLLVGKILGVFFFSLLAVKLKLAALPTNVNLKHILGVAMLAGVGFTMSLFIGNLAFANELVYLDSAKVGILIGSLVAGILGYVFLKITLKKTVL